MRKCLEQNKYDLDCIDLGVDVHSWLLKCVPFPGARGIINFIPVSAFGNDCRMCIQRVLSEPSQKRTRRTINRISFHQRDTTINFY